MKKLIPDILPALGAGERVVLAIVLSSCGSTPRKTGSVMAVFQDGRSAGTIGGGAIEFAVQRLCRDEMMTAPENQLVMTEGYTLLPDGKGDLHMICGGDVTIFFITLLPNNDTISVFSRALESDGNARLEIDTTTGEMFISEGAEKLARPHYNSECKRLAYPLSASGFVYVFGGGHVGRALVETLTRLDFDCVVFDDRERYSSEAEHPYAVRCIFGDYTKISEHVTLTGNDYVVVVTHGHQFDYDVLAQTLPSKARYVGSMGSRRKTAVIKERLRNERGLSDEIITQLHSPIGLQIGAETPEELAVSIAAELIAFRAGK